MLNTDYYLPKLVELLSVFKLNLLFILKMYFWPCFQVKPQLMMKIWLYY